MLFQLPRVQEKLAKELSLWVKDSFNLSVKAAKLKVGFFSGLAIDEVLLLDSKNDTLISVEELRVSTMNLSFGHLNKVYLKGLVLNCTYSESIYDSEWYKLIQPLLGETETSKALKVNHVWVNGAQLNLVTQNSSKRFTELNLYLKDLNLANTSEFTVSSINWKMPNGQGHRASVAQVKLADWGTQIKGFNWKSGTSEIDFDLKYTIDTDSVSFVNLNTFKVNKIASQGLFHQWPDSLELNLNTFVELQNNRLSTKNFSLATGKGSSISGALVIANFTDFERWNYQLKAPVFSIVESEWEWLEPIFKYHYLVSNLGDINADVNLEGTLSKLSLQMDVASTQGNFSTDIFINTDSVNTPFYEGDIELMNFNLASIVKKYNLANINANLSVRGKGFNLKSFDTNIDGEISAIGIGNYTYKDIKLNGRLQPNYFKGEAFVDDKNLELDFSGEVDFSKSKPIMDFTADIIEANLVQLKWYDKEPVAILSSLVEINLEGDKWANIEGGLGVYFTTIETEDNYYHFNDLLFKSTKSILSDTLILQSDLANAQLYGQIDIPNLYNSFLSYLSPHLPLLPSTKATHQNFNFSASVFNSTALTDLLLPDLNLGDGAYLSGIFNTKGAGLNFSIKSANLTYKDWLWSDLELSSKVTDEHWEIGLKSSKLDYNLETKFENIELDQIGSFGDWRYAIAWTSNDSLKFDGILKANAHINSNSVELDIEQSQFYFADTLWTLNENSFFNYHTNGNINSNLNLSTLDQKIELNYLKTKRKDELNLVLNNFEFENINPWLVKAKTNLEGQLNGDVTLTEINTKPKVTSELNAKNIMLNKYPLGDLEFKTYFNEASKSHSITGGIYEGLIKTIAITGSSLSTLDSTSFNVSFDITQFDVKHLETYLANISDEFSGTGTGRFDLFGSLNKPRFDGELWVEDLFISVPYLNVDLKALTQSRIQFSDRDITFLKFDFVSIEEDNAIGNGSLKGSLEHLNFKDFSMNLSLTTDSLLILNTNAYNEEAYYGRAITTGDVNLSGPFSAIKIDLNARTNKGTFLYIPLDDKESIEELSFIQFVQKESAVNTNPWAVSNLISSNSDLLIDINLDITDDAEVNIIFDETLGDKITAIGKGNINLGVNASKEVYMFGDYTLSQGDYLFTLQNFVNKKFEIESGAQFVWDGNPYKAQVDLTALYNVSTNISNLAPEYNRVTDVRCSMLMTGNLLKPTIAFDVKIPKGDDSMNRVLEERTNTEEKKTQQFLSLLVLNNFMSTDELQNTDVDYLSTTLSTGTEVLSNKLSNWMSQLTDRFDLGIKYHPNQGDTLSNKEFEFLMNNMKVNDRITFNGNIGTLPAQNTTRIIGDFKVEYQLRDDGRLKLLAFRNLEESFQLQDNTSNYTTGIGLFYRDEFDDFTDMWHKFVGMFKRSPKN